MNVAIYIEDEKLDLFQDEVIEITSSVQNVNDITKNTLDYSKNFTVPASNRNNLIFKHWYNADIDNGFDARTRVNGKIEINGVVFKYGKFSLLSVKLKQGKPSSYSLVFYGNAISLADRVGTDELSNLDLSDFDHAYSDVNVRTGFTDSLFSGDIRYPLLAKKRYYYNSSTTNDGGQSNTNHSNIANVSWANGVFWQELRASLRLIRIIEAIETKYGFTFSRNWLNRIEFLNLYLWLDNEKAKEISSEVQLNLTSYLTGAEEFCVIDFVNNTMKLTNAPYVYNFVLFRVHTNPSNSSVNYKFIIKKGNEIVFEVNENNSNGYSDIIYNLERGIEHSFHIESTEINIDYVLISLNYKDGVNKYNDLTTSESQTITTSYTISNQLPKLKIIDFLKGLFSMFKLVFYQEKESDPIYLNTLKDYYSEAVLYDISQYVSTSEAEVERGKLLNEISFKYEDPQTILNKEFKDNTGLGYGDNEFKLEDELGNPLEGEKEEIKVPFEQVLYEKVTDVNPSVNEQINIQVGACVDDKYDAVNVKPLISYIVNHNIAPNSIRFKNNNGSFTTLNSTINTPSHTIDFSDNPAYSLVFDREQNTYTNIYIENTLFNNYHSDYVTSIFKSKRRNYKFTAKLPLRIILKLKLKDVLKINESYFRINTWTYNLLTGVCKLDLINSFDNTLNGFNATRTIINTDYTAKIESVYVTNFENMIFDYEATWLNSVTYLGNNVYFGIDENNTGFSRTAIVTLINSDTLNQIEITINQSANIITADNNIITADNNLITADNG